MSSFTIEVADDDVGIAVPDGDGFRFFASDPRLVQLDGSLHPGWVEAACAARALLRGPRHRVGRRADGSAGMTASGLSLAARPSHRREAGVEFGAPIEAQLIRSEEALVRLLPEWWGMWERAERASPFQSPGWLVPWWTSFRPGELFTVALRRHGELVALAPLYLENGSHGRRLLPIGISVSDALDVLVDPAWREEIRPVLLRVLTNERASWDSLHFEDVPEAAEALALDIPDGYGVSTTNQNAHPVLSLHGLEPAPLRRIEKAWRRAGRHGDVRVVETAGEEVSYAVAELFRLHAAAWEARGEPGVLVGDEIRAFHRAAIPALLTAGIARLPRLEIAGRTAAILYGFIHRGRASAYLSGYDPAFAHESPGSILLDTFIRQAARAGVREFDFLRGRERYKYDWGAVDRWTARLVIAPGSHRSSAAD